MVEEIGCVGWKQTMMNIVVIKERRQIISYLPFKIVHDDKCSYISILSCVFYIWNNNFFYILKHCLFV